MKIRKHMLPMVYAFAALCMFVSMVAVPAVVLAKYYSYEGEAAGTVLDVEVRRSRKHRKYRITYSYAADGTEYTAVSPWGRSARGAVGQEILVRYDPERPADAMTSLEKTMAEAMLCASAVTGTVAAAMGLANGRKRKRRRRGTPDGVSGY